MKKKLSGQFKVLIALILTITMLLLPFDTLAWEFTNNGSTPDEADLSATGASVLSGEGSQDNPYLIQSSDDWDTLSESINSSGTDYSGKYFLMTDDITVTTVLGNRPDSSTDSNDNYFSGIFDGDGHTLNVNINESGFGAAPFAIAHNATIKNLHVTGTITSGANHATGLVAASKGRSIYDESSLTIQNVTVSADISCPSHVAGIVGHAHSANITMENVVFDGSLSASSVQGGMIGWGGLGNGARYSSSFKDCLFAGTYNTNAAFYPVAFANNQGSATLINDFYTTKLGSGGSPIPLSGDGQLKLLAAQVEKDGSVQYFDNINTAADGSNWVAGSTLKLMTDITNGATITVPSGEHTLDLNGHGIKMTGSGSVITVNNGATLNLDDSAPTTEHKFTVANAKSNGAGLATVNDTLTGEYKTFTGGYITGGNATNGGGIKVNGTADLTMNGGTIIGNHSSFMGAGIKADNNGDDANVNITVNGGAVIYNTVNGYGAGICSDGAVRINGGTIAYNVASNNPGGIHCHYLYISGGRVENNFAGATDYAAGAHADHEVFISGSPVINDNLVNGAPSNLDWDRTEYRHGHKLILTDALTEGAKISVTMRVDGKGEFTNGWKANMGTADPSKFFTSDNPDYEVFPNNNGEAEIGIVPHEHDDLSFTKWSDTTALPPTAGNYCLSADVTISSRWDVPAGTTNLCLNGHSITRTNASSNTGMVINVGSGAVLNLYDCDDETTHYYTVDDPSPNGAGLGRVVDESTYQAAGENARGTFKGGYITGGSITGENNGTSHLVGGGVNVDSGSFTLNGGTIIGNSVTWNGGGVKVRGKNASFTMNGGAILANWNRYYGGGISVGDNNAGNVCKLKINGGTIRHNWSGRNGGAIHLDGKAHTVLINGGNIIDNYTDGNLESTGRSGGGILTDVTSVQLSGTPVIKGNAIKSGVSNDVSVRANGSDRLDLSGHLEQGADVGIYVPGWTSANADYMVATGAEQSDIRYVHYDAPSEGLLLFCDGSKDWICLDGALVELSGGHHTHQAGTVWVSGLPVAAVTAGETTTLYGSLDAAVNAWTAGSTLKLLTDVTTSSTITVPSGEHALDLNGYGIRMTGNDRVITINQGASLELNDSDPDRIHYITLTNYRGTAVSDSGEESVSNGNGVIKVTGGYLTGGYRNNSGSHDRCGAGVYNWGTFVMNGGSIVGNTLYNNSGGAIRNSGYFTMNGGTIAFNYASGNGGGITTYVPGGSQGKMTMNGGEISDNYCGSYGGGIQIAGPIEMTGGSVVRNTAGAGGSGVFYDGKNDRFKLSGNPVIKDNSNNDDLYLGANATFMINGSLTEEADIHVLMNTPAEFTVGWKNIMGNADPSKYFTSANSGYAVILNNNGEAEVGIPPAVCIINGETTTYYNVFSDAQNAWTEGSTLKLMKDATTSSTITVPTGTHTLDLNGYALKAGSAGYSVITVGSGADLTINDTAGKDGKITGGSVGQNYGGGVTVDGGTLMLKGGAISGNANTHGGIGNCGGGVHVRNSGKFYMEGGEISGNTSYVGGGVCSDASATTVSITGGVIKNNKTDRFGSAVWAGRSSSAIFRIGGDAQIVDNISTWTADKDGEASLNFSTLLLSGDPTVHGDWKTSGTSSPNTHINLDNDGSGVQRLTLEGALTNDTGVPSITMSPIYRWSDLSNGQTFVFTKNWDRYMGTAHPADYFKVDDSVSGVRIIRKNGEAAVTGGSDLGDLYITFDANEGEGEMDPQLTTVTNVTLNENTFTREGCCFAGWNTEKDGSGTGYYDKASVTLTGDLTLYAQWKEPAASIISGETATDYAYIADAVSAWTAGSTLKLLADVTTSSTIAVPTGEHTLDLNGYGITYNGSADAYVFNIKNGVTLNLYDSGNTQRFYYIGSSSESRFPVDYVGFLVDSESNSDYQNAARKGSFNGGYITGGKGSGGFTMSGGAFNMYGGCIFGNYTYTRAKNSNSGGAINLSGGTFTMHDGYMIGNQCDQTGGAINIGSATFIMHGGEILHNTSGYMGSGAGWGGGVRMFAGNNSHFTMDGGSITGNYAKYQGGVSGSGIFTMNGGTISGNNSSASGNGAGLGEITSFTISGSVQIKNNRFGGTFSNGELTGGSENNLYLKNNQIINVSEELSDTSSIGVTMQSDMGILTSGWKDNMGNSDPSGYFISDNDDYIIALNDSVEACLRYPDVPDVSAEGFEGDYDGAAHSITVTAPDGVTIKYGTKEGSYTLTDSPTYTNAGTYIVYYEVSKEKYTSVYGSAVVQIDPIDVTVTITGHNTAAVYDGKAHSVSGYDVSIRNDLYTEDDFTFSGTAKAERTDAGTTQMGLAPDQFENTNGNFATVTFEVTDGYVTIDPKAVTVTIVGHNSTADYNGNLHDVSGYDVTAISDSMYSESDFTFNSTAAASRTDAGTTYMELTADKFENTNGNFAVTFDITDGYQKIEPISVGVAIIGYNKTADYNGKSHSVSGYIAAFSTPLYTESDFTFSGTAKAERTDAGTTMMLLASDQFENINSNFKNVTFTVVDGFVTIDPIDVTVTVIGHNDTVDYDGKTHSVVGYDATADSKLYDVNNDFKYNGSAEAVRIDAGTTEMGLTAEKFENINSNFAAVTFEVTDGYITVDPVDVVVTVTGHNDTVDYDGKSHSAEGYDAVASSDLYDVTTDFTFSGAAKAERTDAGTTEMGLTAEQFKNTNGNFANVSFVITDGYMTVEPIDVKVVVTGNSGTIDYDGKSHTVSGYTFTATSALYTDSDFTFSGTAKAQRTDAGTTNMGLSAEQFENTNSNFATVTFEVTDGSLTIDPIDVTVTITGHNSTVDYDGTSHRVTGYEAVASSDLYDVAKDFTFSGMSKAERTNAGTTVMGLEAARFENTNSNFATVTFEVTDGYLTVNPIDVTVTVTGHNDTADYDGKAHSAEGYDAVANSDLYDVDNDFIFSGTAKAERTDAGKTNMGLKAEQFKNTNGNFANVTFEITDGYIKIDPIDVTVTITGYYFSTDYDGEAHSAEGYEVEIGDPLYSEADFTFSGTDKAQRTNAGTTYMGLMPEQFENTNSNFATVVFDVTDGYVTINPIDVTVTITGHNSTVDYDGKAHSIEGYDAVVSSDLYDVTNDFTFNGTAKAERTDAGTTNMGLAANQFKNTNSNFATVTFEVTDGYMTVDPIDVTVTITGHNSTVDYDGKAHSIEGYDAVASSDLYDVTNDFTFSGTAKAERTDACTTNMGLAAGQFKNTNSNFATVTFEVTDGYMTIDPIDVTVTITGHNSTVDYDGKAHSIEGYDAVASFDLYNVTNDFTFSGTAKAERADAGTTKMGLIAGQFKNTNSNFATVTFEVTDGYMTVDPIDVTVTITGHNSTVDYDGKAHSIEGYDAVASFDLYNVTNDFTFNGTAKAERTDAGTTKMGLAAGQFKNTNDNFATVTFEVTDGYMTVDPIDVTVTITGHNSTVDYDGKAHSIEGYDAVVSSDLYDATNDFTFSGTAKAERTDAGTTKMGLAPGQFKNTNDNFATVTFEVTDGYMTIDPIDVTVTITGHNSTVDYDGKAHSIEGYDAVASSDLYDVTNDFTFNGTAKAERTDAGTTKMGLAANQFKNTNSNFATVTFEVTDGYITVDPIDVTVTITGHNDTFEYDGTSHRVTGYDAVASSDLYDVAADFIIHGLSKAERTDVGTIVMGLEAALFENQNDNFSTVIFNVTDGYLTIVPTDAIITAAPGTKEKLVYNGEEQELILAGSVNGGTLLYAIGEDAQTAPADENYSVALPKASEIGNYYIWYKVEGDSNHNGISPACFKITLADDGWVTISGNISQSSGSPVSEGASVILMKGDTVVDEIKADKNGSYYFTVPADVYNIVVSSGDVTVTNIVDGHEDTVHDLIAPDADNESVLDVSASDKSIVVGGLDSEANAIRAAEGIPADKKVSVRMTVESVNDSSTTGAQQISGQTQDMSMEYFDMKVEKTVDSVTFSLDETQTVLEIVIPCSYTNKRELTVLSSDGSGVQTFTESDSKASGTYRVDKQSGLVYVYSDRITTCAIGYKPYYSVKSKVTLGSFSGNVSVTLVKDGTGETYELNNVSLDNISFSGIPKGTYSMTVTWTDGAENTITTPFII